MAVREFDGVDDDIQMSVATVLADLTHGTFAILAKRNSTANWRTWFGAHTSGGAGRTQIAFHGASGMAYWNGGSSVTGTTTTTNGVWQLVVIRKADGSAAPRISAYNFDTEAWTHASLGTLGNATSPGSGGTIRFDYETFNERFTGLVAVNAAWSNAVPWSADTTGDAAIEGAGLHTSLQSWAAAEPSALWAFDQASTTDDVVDLMGNGCDQVAISGTTVITGDDPPGFDFSTGAVEIAADVAATAALAADAEVAGSPTIDADVTATAEILADAIADEAIFVFADIAADCEVVPSGDVVSASAALTSSSDVAASAAADRSASASVAATASVTCSASVVTPGAAVFDTFTATDGTSLAVHTSDSGHTWNTDPTDGLEIQSGRCVPAMAGGRAISSATGFADVTVEATINFGPDGVARAWSHRFRWADNDNFLFVKARRSATPVNQIELWERVDGTNTRLRQVTLGADVFAADTDYQFRVEADADTIRAYVDDVELMAEPGVTQFQSETRLGLAHDESISSGMTLDDYSAQAFTSDSVDAEAAAVAELAANAAVTRSTSAPLAIEASHAAATSVIRSVTSSLSASAVVTAEATVIRSVTSSLSVTSQVTTEAGVTRRVSASVSVTATVASEAGGAGIVTAAASVAVTADAAASATKSSVASASLSAVASLAATVEIGEPPPLVNLHFVALGPTLAHGATVLLMKPRAALSPEAVSRTAARPEITSRLPGEPTLSHDASDVALAHDASDVALAHGRPGEPAV